MTNRLKSSSGIAIGPILFIVAILAILATAIAAGSGTFASNSSQEANRTNAAMLIQIGQTLKFGMDRLIITSVPLANVVINAQNTTNNVDVFSPTGGGLAAPSSTLSLTGSDPWIYSWADVTNLGTSGTDGMERLAILKVSEGVCNQINTQAGAPPDATNNEAGDFGTNIAANITANWPANLDGRMVGCFMNSNGTAAYYFYQVLAVQ